ncbi:DNA/RNA polymerases superfamily protein [Gossypium australe]|uniref:DNA/RNA polymerases superfamily protein n=1 Tax=Gossypium australe TaxID=47621 RepID=A0A5B6WRC8_9ROSI|nr:DNA/RNA polymerases superfamily protein [Gossypium australe]
MEVGTGYHGFCIGVAIVSPKGCYLDYSLGKLVELYVAEIVRLHGVPYSLHVSTAFYPQTDGQSERVLQVLEDMLRCCILEFEGNWENFLPLVEFAYNNSYQSSTKIAPYEALYCWKCRTPLYWTELSEKKLFDTDLIQKTKEKVKVIRESLKTTSDRQKSYADLKRKDIEYQVIGKVFFKVSP